MPTRIFKVDLSEGARDFQPTATEPGLAMLDRQGVNHQILRRWLGDFVADPEWQGDYVHFFIREEERGRLENVECYPATKADLEGPLKADLDALSARIKKAKPDSGTEQLLHRIVRQTFASLTTKLEESDHDSFFFQYREPGQPWKLVWAWGYQRADLQPARSLICGNPQCGQLFVRRANGDDSCPGCTSRGGRIKGGWPLGLTWQSLAIAALVLLGAMLLFALLNPPTLVVTPEQGQWPLGAKAEFKIVDQRYYFWRTDVTGKVLAQSNDRRILEFEPLGARARTRGVGSTQVTFHYQDRVATAIAGVDPPDPPDSISVEPKELKLGVGSVGRVKVIGHYEGQADRDLTDSAEFQVADDKVVFGTQGLFEGASAGKTKITARVLKDAFGDSADAELDVEVVKVDYKDLLVGVAPDQLALQQNGVIAVQAQGQDGGTYDFVGSTQLQLAVDPATVASVDGGFLHADSSGRGKLHATLSKGIGGLTAACDFQVGDVGLVAADTFDVSPRELTLSIDEYFTLNVVSGSGEPIVGTSSVPEIVEVLSGGKKLLGRKAGEAEVTLQQGAKTAVVKVRVEDAKYARLVIIPAFMQLRVDEVRPVRVLATTVDGKEVEIAPERLVWVAQPPAENAYFDRDRLLLSGKSPTIQPKLLRAQLGPLLAEASIEVVGLSADIIASAPPDEDFGVYPPIGVGVTRLPGAVDGGRLIGPNDLIYDIGRGGLIVGDYGQDGLLYQARIPRGARIRRVGKKVFDGMTAAEIRRYLASNPLARNDEIEYLDEAGNVGRVVLGEQVGIVQEVKFIDVRPLSLKSDSFVAEVHMELRQSAEYRVVDAEGKILGDWTKLPAGPASLASMPIPRLADQDASYKLYIERRLDEQIRKFEVQFKLKQDGP